MKIAIADDMENERAELAKCLRRWEEKKGARCAISEYADGEGLLDGCKKEVPQLVFMDIYMQKGMDGIMAAKELRSMSKSCLIVFLTSSREHAWDAFPLHPFDYVVKSWDEETIFRIMDEAAESLNEEKYVEFTSGRQKMRLHVSEIGYIASDNHHIIMVTQAGDKIKCYSPFGIISKQLESDGRFIVCNRGIIVNMDYIDKCDNKSFLMKNGERLPLRIRDVSVLQNAYADYTFKKVRRWR